MKSIYHFCHSERSEESPWACFRRPFAALRVTKNRGSTMIGMTTWQRICFGAIGALFLTAPHGAQADGPLDLTPVPFQDVHIRDSFWSPRIETNRKTTVEAN